MLVEYKPFEPAFYATDIADWGMSFIYSKYAGPRTKVLVDTGHHYQTQNIEQIVAWLLSEDMLGGFHFNDRRYADDDLTLGCMDPYQVFRIFHEICYFSWETGKIPDIAYMVDQSHNLKNKIEEYDPDGGQRAGIVREGVSRGPRSSRFVSNEDGSDRRRRGVARSFLCRRPATHQRVAVVEGLAEDPLRAFRESGYLQNAEKDRAERNRSAVSTYAKSASRGLS